MKKTFLLLMINVCLVASLFSQDIMDGQLDIEPEGSLLNFTFRIFTDETMGITRDYVDVRNLGHFLRLYKSQDSLVSPLVRYQEFSGAKVYSSNFINIFGVTDSVPINKYKNLSGNHSYAILHFDVEYRPTNEPIFNDFSPYCNSYSEQVQGTNGTITLDLNCQNTNNGNMLYHLNPPSNNAIGGSAFQAPSPNNYSVDTNGVMTWVAPQDTGRYLFVLYLVDLGGSPLSTNPSYSYRIFTVSVKPYMFTSTKAVIPKNLLQVFPNPTTNHLSIQFDSFTPRNAKIQIFDIVGKLVYQQAMQNQKESVDISLLNKGVYIVRVQSEGKTWAKKVVKQ